MKVLSLIGARPQFIKEALVGAAVRERNAWQHVLLHSGQHYDTNMSDVFFEELGIPQPEYYLGIGSGSHASMTAKALTATENILLQEKPDALLVYGDTNTTLAGALAAAKLAIPIIHIEAGIRMMPRTMPEEINRVLTDRIATVMCCCSQLGQENLAADGIHKGVFVTGDVMYDLYCRMQSHFTPEALCTRYNIRPQKFVLTTLHRDYTVDNAIALTSVVDGLIWLQKEYGLRVLWPVHPRARKRLVEFDLMAKAQHCLLVEPLGYMDLMSLLGAASFVISDSGGLQKEAYYAHKRCVVLMPDTGWRELIDNGWNVLSQPSCKGIQEGVQRMLDPVPCIPHVYGQGNAAQQSVDAILQSI